MSRYVRFNGRESVGERDNVATPPLAGIWFAGDEVEFSPALCQNHNRQCEQVTGEPCEKGIMCDCWADQFVLPWNVGHENQSPPPFEVIEREDEPLDLPEDPEEHDAPPPAADATFTPEEDAASAAEDQ